MKAIAWLGLLAVSTLAGAEATAPENMKLFLLIGQSNMAGRGLVEAQDTEINSHVLMLSKEGKWVPAVDPMHFDKPERIGTGLGKTFGLFVADAAPDAVIGLVPAAFGGSALDEWAPGQRGAELLAVGLDAQLVAGAQVDDQRLGHRVQCDARDGIPA